eukprot:gnl/MRDRNA2_/MRDRNA2_277599_c0_seq1.p2 gnl/MRDRNA2_/MRDRNA2_277599_c0~~gnl/MRDRNA2_/MRDRNA2_277599_c0_seq1.p2  ORF type:complete len:108 (+),score=12.27 gnl/MRDRNA2_/MRDRNA2_277599_c0_seq1:97-420(+)
MLAVMLFKVMHFVEAAAIIFFQNEEKDMSSTASSSVADFVGIGMKGSHHHLPTPPSPVNDCRYGMSPAPVDTTRPVLGLDRDFPLVLPGFSTTFLCAPSCKKEPWAD